VTKQISTEMTPENVARILTLLREAPGRLERWGQGRSPEDLRRPLGQGERSGLEVLAHLLNTEALSSASIYLALLLKEPELPPIHAERDLGKLLQLGRLAWADLLTYYRVRRAVLLGVLEGLKEAQWARVVREHGKQRKESVYWRARGLALHEGEHLGQLEDR
jgi:hypothetical protein